MIEKELLEILRCPNCAQEKKGSLTMQWDTWLICDDCGRKYPIIDSIPVMLLKEGDKWVGVKAEDLPVTPPPVK